MNKITLPQKVLKSVKGKKQFNLMSDSVVETFKDGKMKAYKIQNISKAGIYCDNDEFYYWNQF